LAHQVRRLGEHEPPGLLQDLDLAQPTASRATVPSSDRLRFSVIASAASASLAWASLTWAWLAWAEPAPADLQPPARANTVEITYPAGLAADAQPPAGTVGRQRPPR